MKLAQRVMKILAPSCERQRMEFREGLAKVQAHTEDLMRTMRFTPEEAAKWKPSSPKQTT